MLGEVSRVLRPGGVYLMITSQAPQVRWYREGGKCYAVQLRLAAGGHLGFGHGPLATRDATLTSPPFLISPQGRFRYLRSPTYCWGEVEVWEVGQQMVVEGPYDLSHLLGQAEAAAAEGGTEVEAEAEGPLKALGLPKQPYSHFVYVCRKQLSPGARAPG